jgi:hypothetical protein
LVNTAQTVPRTLYDVARLNLAPDSPCKVAVSAKIATTKIAEEICKGATGRTRMAGEITSRRIQQYVLQLLPGRLMDTVLEPQLSWQTWILHLFIYAIEHSHVRLSRNIISCVPARLPQTRETLMHWHAARIKEWCFGSSHMDNRREPTPASSRWPWCNPATFYIYVHLDQTRAAPLQPLSDRSTKKPAKLELTNLRLVEPGKSRQAIRTNRGSPKTHGTIRWRCCKTNWLVRIGVFGRIRWMRGRARNTSRVLPTPRVTPELFSLG